MSLVPWPPKKSRRVEGTTAKADTVRVDHKVLVQRGNSLQVKFVVSNYNTACAFKNINKFVLNSNDVVFQVRVVATQMNNGHSNTHTNYVLVRFFKQRIDEDDDSLIYMITLNCSDFSITDKIFFTDDGTWHLLHENIKQHYSFLVNLTIQVATTSNSFATLYSDNELTDFELRGEDGAIRVHKAVFAVASPVFQRMLAGTWKETAEGYASLPGTSKITLRNFKKYIYRHTLPSVGLEQLLLLASYYMMPELEQKCVELLMKDLKAQKAFDLLEFASKNKVTRLVLAILDAVQNGEVLVKDIRSHALTSSSS